MSVVRLYCDGSGGERMGRPGGWAFVLVDEHERVLLEAHGREAKTTSLVMELTAMLRGLEAWRGDGSLLVLSDCSIALDVAEGRFRPRPPRYHALCDALRAAFVASGATSRWLRGHAGERWNEEVDRRAAQARASRPPVPVHPARE